MKIIIISIWYYEKEILIMYDEIVKNVKLKNLLLLRNNVWNVMILVGVFIKLLLVMMRNLRKDNFI